MGPGRDVLVLAHRAPVPPLTGSQVKPHHIVRRLAAAGWRVHLRCFGDEADRERAPMAWSSQGPATTEIVSLSPLRAAISGALGVPRGRSLTDCWHDMPAMRRSVRDAVERHGIRCAIGYSSAMAQFVPEPLRARSFIELADLDSAKFEAYVQRHRWPMSSVYRIEASRLARRERQIVETFGRCSLVSERERDLMRQRWPGLPADKLAVMTNGVDTEAFSPEAARAALDAVVDPAERRLLGSDRSPTLVFTGVMDYRPNVEAVCGFARDVLPAIRARHPDARFLIVGSRPSPEVTALGTLPGVHVTGFVPDVRPYLACADVAVIPLSLARGIQNKALEAMSCGTLVACSTATHEGIGAQPGRDYWVADTLEQWLGVVDRAMLDPAGKGATRSAGRRFVADHHGWEAVLAPLMGFLGESGR